MGGKGCISVTANVAPRLCAEFQSACATGDWTRALELQDRLYPLHDAMFSDCSPGPVKYALSRVRPDRSEEHTSELQSLMRISYAVFCLKKKKTNNKSHQTHTRC